MKAGAWSQRVEQAFTIFRSPRCGASRRPRLSGRSAPPTPSQHQHLIRQVRVAAGSLQQLSSSTLSSTDQQTWRPSKACPCGRTASMIARSTARCRPCKHSGAATATGPPTTVPAPWPLSRAAPLTPCLGASRHWPCSERLPRPAGRRRGCVADMAPLTLAPPHPTSCAQCRPAAILGMAHGQHRLTQRACHARDLILGSAPFLTSC